MASRFMIAAPTSNSGKTTVTVGLCKLFRERGLGVQPFKCGPDFIDTKLLTRAAGRAAINLDAFMMGAGHIGDLFVRYGQAAEVSIVEGVMGLFDGAVKMEGSSAALAMMLDLPVVLVMNAKAMAYSAAPLLHGFRTFRPGLKLAGVIFNQVRTASHYEFLKEAAADAGVKSLGYIPPNEDISLPSRHLGLSHELASEDKLAGIAAHLSKTLDLDALLALGETSAATVTPPLPAPAPDDTRPLLAVAQDEAFNFIYPENIRALEAVYQVTYFSPLHDTVLPPADIVYIPGGYPELHLPALAANEVMRTAMYAYASQGGKVFAECGGMMYLGKTLTDASGQAYPMVGFLDYDTSFTNAQLMLGYRKFEHGAWQCRGHEFHYSTIHPGAGLNTLGTLRNAKDQPVHSQVFIKQQTVATYMHFYWAEDRTFFQRLFKV